MTESQEFQPTTAGDWGDEIAPALVQITNDAPFYWGVYQGREEIEFADGKGGLRHFFDSPQGQPEIIIGTAQLNTILARVDYGDAVVIELTGEMRARSGNYVKQFSVRARKPDARGYHTWPDGQTTHGNLPGRS